MDGLNSAFNVNALRTTSVAVATASFGNDYVMEPKRVITASQAAALVPSNCTITTGGFGSCGHPDLLTDALAARFIATAQPTGLTLVFAAGQGDKVGRGLNRLAIKGLLKKVVGGYWALAPSIGQMALRGENRSTQLASGRNKSPVSLYCRGEKWRFIRNWLAHVHRP